MAGPDKGPRRNQERDSGNKTPFQSEAAAATDSGLVPATAVYSTVAGLSGIEFSPGLSVMGSRR